MKSNWEDLESKVYQNDIDGVCEWLRRFKKYPHTPVREYLNMDSDESWLHECIQVMENREAIEKFAALPEEYIVSVEEIRKVLFPRDPK